MILANFPKKSWGDIETVEPDEFDKKMLADIKSNADCREFVSPEEAMKELGLD